MPKKPKIDRQRDSSAYALPEGVKVAQKYHFHGGWVAMALAIGKVFADMTSLNDTRVFGEMLSQLAPGNAMVVSQRAMAQNLNMLPQNVSRSIKALVAAGLIIECERTGVNKTYMLNPSYGWRGTARSHQAAIAQRRERRGRFAVIEGTKPLA